MMRNRQFGRIRIAADLVYNRVPEVTRLMGMCSILRAELLAAENQFEYTATCRHFRKVPPGERLPKYKVTFTADGDIQFSEISDWWQP